MKKSELRKIIREEIIKSLNEVDVTDRTIKNPETGKMIKVSTALGYGENHPAYKAAKMLLRKPKANKDKPSKKDITSLGRKYFSHTTPQKVETGVRNLEKHLSPEGLKIVYNFMKGSQGVNRTWKLDQLDSLFNKGKATIAGETVHSLTKGDLKSYANKDLYKLIDTGDLVEKNKRYYPKNSPYLK